MYWDLSADVGMSRRKPAANQIFPLSLDLPRMKDFVFFWRSTQRHLIQTEHAFAAGLAKAETVLTNLKEKNTFLSLFNDLDYPI